LATLLPGGAADAMLKSFQPFTTKFTISKQQLHIEIGVKHEHRND
jgi:hypothetical protein